MLIIKSKLGIVDERKVNFKKDMGFSMKYMKTKLGEVADVIMGQSPKGNTYNSEKIGIPVLNGPTEFGFSHPIPATWTVSPTKICKEKDLLFCVRGSTTGRMNWADQKYCIGRGIAAIRSNTSDTDTKYIYYTLVNELLNLLSLSSGSVFPNISKKDLESFEIFWPEKAERNGISDTLSKLDQKIELNLQLNSTLEQIAQTLFKHWFIDFEFPDENGNPYKSSGGRMVDSELGEIPEGWNVKKVDEILELAYGKALKEDIRIPGSIPVYGSNGQVGWHNEKLVDGPGIVVGRKGNPGTVTWVHTHFYPIDTTFYVVPKGPVKSLYYLLYALKKQDLPSLAADSAVPGLNRNMVYMNKMIVPETDILDLFNIYLNNIYQKIKVNEKQSRILGSIRDSLLPKLMSGKIRVEC